MGVKELLRAKKDVTNIRHRVTIAQKITGVTSVHLHLVTNVVIVTDEAKSVTINVAIALETVSGHDRGMINDVTVQGHVMKSVANVLNRVTKSVVIVLDRETKSVVIVLNRASVTIITNVITRTRITRTSFVITQSTEKRARNTSK